MPEATVQSQHAVLALETRCVYLPKTIEITETLPKLQISPRQLQWSHATKITVSSRYLGRQP